MEVQRNSGQQNSAPTTAVFLQQMGGPPELLERVSLSSDVSQRSKSAVERLKLRHRFESQH